MGFLDTVLPKIYRPLTSNGHPEAKGNGTTFAGRVGPGPSTPIDSPAALAVRTENRTVQSVPAAPRSPRSGNAPAPLALYAWDNAFMQVLFPVRHGNLGTGYPTVGRVRPVPAVQFAIMPYQVDKKVRRRPNSI